MNKAINESTLKMKGRWYTVRVSSDGTTPTIESVDADLTGASISSTYLKTVENFHVIDYLMDISTDSISSAVTISKGIRKYADGTHGVVIPAVASYTDLIVSIYGYFE